MIAHAFDHLIAAGVSHLIVNTHHAAPMYQEIFPDAQWRGVPITFRHEPVLLDTAGGIKNIEDLLAEEPLWVYNGDIVTTLPLDQLWREHAESGAEATLALRRMGTPLNVGLDSAGWVQDLRGTIGTPGLTPALFTGIYCIEKRFLNRLTPGKVESVVQVFLRMIQSGNSSSLVRGVVLDDGEWSDVGTLEEYRRLA